MDIKKTAGTASLGLLLAAVVTLFATWSFSQPSVQNPGILKAVEVQDRHTATFLENPEVVGTATGLDEDGNPAVIVFTLSGEARGIPERLDGVPVVVETTGMFVARADPTAEFNRPVPIGVSTGHPDITAGTIGCRVADQNGFLYALSNNHVYAVENNATPGDSALQPGPYDGGTDPEHRVGELYDFVPIIFDDTSANNLVDAARAAVDFRDFDGDGTDENGISTTTPDDGYGIPNSVIFGDGNGDGSFDNTDDLLNLKVQKYGRTTGLTRGKVTEINVTVDVCYECAGPFCFNCKKFARFTDQLGISPGEFSAGGDSGSLIVTDDSGKNPVGLLFAGSSTRTLANRIDHALNAFNVTVDDQETTAGGEAGSGDGGGGDGSDSSGADMYVWEILWSEKHFGRGGSNTDLRITVDINEDSDSDLTAESGDSPAPGASTSLVLIHDTNGNGTFGDSGDDSWNFGGETDTEGQVSFTLKFAPDGDYLAEVTALTHSALQWNSSLDADNPDDYLGVPGGTD